MLFNVADRCSDCSVQAAAQMNDHLSHFTAISQNKHEWTDERILKEQ